MTAQLIEFPDRDLSDVPAMLRKLANAVENGDYPGVTGAAVVLEAPQMPVFGYGSCDSLNASDLFSCAHLKLTQMRLNHLLEL